MPRRRTAPQTPVSTSEHHLSYLNDEVRLSLYNNIIQGCSHIYSKGKLVKERLIPVLNDLMRAAEEDPIFLAHFTSYAVNKLDSKDLKLLSVFANSLSDADGTPFVVGTGENGKPLYGNIKKPNLRIVSQAAIQNGAFDAKMIERLIEVANIKQSLGKRYREGTHFSKSLKTAITKYIRFREANPKSIEGIKKVGLAKRFANIYRAMHLSPSPEAASILGWKQKKGEDFSKKSFFNFKGMSDIQIAEKIRGDKLPPTGVLGALPGKISPVIAAAVLEQATGDQAVILRELFDSQGLLKHKEVKELFSEKIKTAKTALDRVDRINTTIDAEVQRELKSARAHVRKEQVGDIGKIFLHIDVSGSMEGAIAIAKEKGAILAECVKSPENNFHWGLFGSRGRVLKRPSSYEKDGFMAALYGVRANDGSTDCLGLYEEARKIGCDVDVFLTDGGHNVGDVESRIKKIHSSGRYALPRTAVIIRVGNYSPTLRDGLQGAGIAVTEITPEALTESALVTQVVKKALAGATYILDEIMDTPLLKLPQWWDSV